MRYIILLLTLFYNVNLLAKKVEYIDLDIVNTTDWTLNKYTSCHADINDLLFISSNDLRAKCPNYDLVQAIHEKLEIKVGRANPIRAITYAKLRMILDGRYKKWREVVTHYGYRRIKRPEIDLIMPDVIANALSATSTTKRVNSLREINKYLDRHNNALTIIPANMLPNSGGYLVKLVNKKLFLDRNLYKSIGDIDVRFKDD